MAETHTTITIDAYLGKNPLIITTFPYKKNSKNTKKKGFPQRTIKHPTNAICEN